MVVKKFLMNPNISPDPMPRSESGPGGLYSWWGDSQPLPKNSKWLQENLSDMDAKVKAVIKLIEEDADSFTTRAEMFHKKQPEIMKFVEEFYRAYGALAEMYDHAIGELHQAHRTTPEALPNQVSSEPSEDSPSRPSTQGHEPHTTAMFNPTFALLDSDDFPTSKAATEVQMMKEVLVKLQAERDAGLLQHKECMKRISSLESTISQAQADAKVLIERAIRAEVGAEHLEKQLSMVQNEKDAGLLHYKLFLDKVPELEKVLSLVREESRLLNERADSAKSEVLKLEKALAEPKEEKEAAGAFKYEHCLVKLSKLESECSCAQEDIMRLNSAMLMETARLKRSAESCVLLQTSNQSLQVEADKLSKRIAMKDQELSKKHEELAKLRDCVQDEHLRFVQVEATVLSLQKIKSQSQEEQRPLALELKNELQKLKDLRTGRRGFEDICQVEDENDILNELNSLSTISMENLRNEIRRLQEMKEKLEAEVGQHLNQTYSLQQEIFHLKEDIMGLNKIYQALMEHVGLVDLNPERIGSSVKELQDENSKLRQIYKDDRDEKEALFKELDDIEQFFNKNAVSEKSSLLDLISWLEGSRQRVKALHESCQSLNGKKYVLVAENAALLSQLETTTEKTKKLMEKNIVLENSLCGANAELEGLRQICKLLNNDKSNLLTERSTLVLRLQNGEKRLERLDNDRESPLSKVKELKVTLGAQEKGQGSLAPLSGLRLANLENCIQLLQEETRWREKEYEEGIDKAVIAQFEIFILQKFIQDMEHKNYSLLIECQKHVEESKLTDKMIAELESEKLKHQVEAELLLDEIGRLRLGIHQVFKVLELSPYNEPDAKIGNEQIFVHHVVVESIENMKCSLLNYEDDRQQLLVENSVISTLLGQVRLEGVELVSEKEILDQEFKTMAGELVMVRNEKDELLEANRQLQSEVNKGGQYANTLEAEMEKQVLQMGDLQRAHHKLQEEYSQVLEENSSLLKNLSDLKGEKCMVEEENNLILVEALSGDNLFVVFRGIATQQAMEISSLSEDLNTLRGVNGEHAKEVVELRGKLETKETEILLLKDSTTKLEMELHEVSNSNSELSQEIYTQNVLLCLKETELSVAEHMIEATENLNSELSKTVEGLKKQHEESIVVEEILKKRIRALRGENDSRSKEVVCLQKVNENLENELGVLRVGVEEGRIKEVKLSAELQEINNACEILEAEALTYYCDLQSSSIREVVFEDKVQEFTRVCETLEYERASKVVELQQVKERVGFVQKEVGGLKAQLFAYSPVIDCLADSIASLEHNIFLSQPKLNSAHNKELEDAELVVHLDQKSCARQELTVDHKSVIWNRIPELQGLQTRIKAVDKVVTEEMKRMATAEAAVLKQIEESKQRFSNGKMRRKKAGLSGCFRNPTTAEGSNV